MGDCPRISGHEFWGRRICHSNYEVQAANIYSRWVCTACRISSRVRKRRSEFPESFVQSFTMQTTAHLAMQLSLWINALKLDHNACAVSKWSFDLNCTLTAAQISAPTQLDCECWALTHFVGDCNKFQPANRNIVTSSFYTFQDISTCAIPYVSETPVIMWTICQPGRFYVEK